MNQENNTQDSSLPVQGAETPGSSSAGKLIIPFEDPGKDFFTGLFETIKLVLFQPTKFFRDYKLDGTMGRPILFTLVVGWFSSIISLIWGLMISESIFTLFRTLGEHLPQFEGFEWEQLEHLGASGGVSDFIFGVVMAPVTILVALFIMAGIYHLFLMIVKGANKSFETTFNVVAYGMASQLAQIIPFCGGLISWIYGIVLGIIGLTEAHETDSWKAVFAVFSPLLLCCLCCILLILILGGTGALIPIMEKIPWN